MCVSRKGDFVTLAHWLVSGVTRLLTRTFCLFVLLSVHILKSSFRGNILLEKICTTSQQYDICSHNVIIALSTDVGICSIHFYDIKIDAKGFICQTVLFRYRLCSIHFYDIQLKSILFLGVGEQNMQGIYVMGTQSEGFSLYQDRRKKHAEEGRTG